MSNIKRFSILGLFDERDVHLDLSQDVTILIADNGVGKTTILGIVYAVLSGKLARLRRVEFRSVEIEFVNGPTVQVPKAIIQPSFQLKRGDPRVRRLLRDIPESLLHELYDSTATADYVEFRRHPLAREIYENGSIPPRYLFDLLRGAQSSEQLELEDLEETPEKIRQAISNYFPSPVLYFPTYRRIEEELEQLGYERKEGIRSEALIQFGMGDVHSRIQSITDEIKKSSIAWYSRINGQMLSQLVVGFKVDAPTRESLQNVDALRIVLDRIGDNISAEHKQQIIELVANNGIQDPKHDYLAYFLSNLIKIYDQQKDLDNSIKAFTGVCKRYLGDKEVVYNESTVEIGIVNKLTGKSIDLAKLSSGEKQIISLFSKLYLEKSEPVALLFDEPELSLSMEWQRMLLPDIMKAGNCSFLLATTHSPFIFENEFDAYARDLREFTTPIQ